MARFSKMQQPAEERRFGEACRASAAKVQACLKKVKKGCDPVIECSRKLLEASLGVVGKTKK